MGNQEKLFNKEKVILHWIESSGNDFETMMQLFNSKSYAWALFLGHISTEKLLKALYVSRFGEHAPFTHNLFRIAELCGLELSAEFADWMDEITAFNLNARYDDYKKEFYKRCTREFTSEWISSRINILQEWIRKSL